jgi:hypothetical protein
MGEELVEMSDRRRQLNVDQESASLVDLDL